MTIQLYAQPYDLDAQGFYFDSVEDYNEKAAANINHYGQPVEEYEMQLIDGTTYPVEPNQANLAKWFENAETFEAFTETEKNGFTYLVDYLNRDVEYALENAEYVNFYEGSRGDYAAEMVEDCYNVNELGPLANYIDYDAFGRDMELGGDIDEFAHNVYVTNATDF